MYVAKVLEARLASLCVLNLSIMQPYYVVHKLTCILSLPNADMKFRRQKVTPKCIQASYLMPSLMQPVGLVQGYITMYSKMRSSSWLVYIVEVPTEAPTHYNYGLQLECGW